MSEKAEASEKLVFVGWSEWPQADFRASGGHSQAMLSQQVGGSK